MELNVHQMRKITFNFHLTLNGKLLQQDSCIKYLGILIDTNLSWKPQIACFVKKIKRSVGILSKLRHYVNIDILTNLYYSLIHPFPTYGIIIWGNTYSTTLQPLYILQKWKSVSNPWERTVVVYLTKCPKCMMFTLPNQSSAASFKDLVFWNKQYIANPMRTVWLVENMG